MSRRSRQTCSRNHPAAAKSEKWDKKKWHRRYRLKNKVITSKLAKQDGGFHEGKNEFPKVSEVSDPWQMSKDRAES